MIGTCQISDQKQCNIHEVLLDNYFADVLQQWEFRIEIIALNNINSSTNICDLQKKLIH